MVSWSNRLRIDCPTDSRPYSLLAGNLGLFHLVHTGSAVETLFTDLAREHDQAQLARTRVEGPANSALASKEGKNRYRKTMDLRKSLQLGMEIHWLANQGSVDADNRSYEQISDLSGSTYFSTNSLGPNRRHTTHLRLRQKNLEPTNHRSNLASIVFSVPPFSSAWLENEGSHCHSLHLAEVAALGLWALDLGSALESPGDLGTNLRSLMVHPVRLEPSETKARNV